MRSRSLVMPYLAPVQMIWHDLGGATGTRSTPALKALLAIVVPLALNKLAGGIGGVEQEAIIAELALRIAWIFLLDPLIAGIKGKRDSGGRDGVKRRGVPRNRSYIWPPP